MGGSDLGSGSELLASALDELGIEASSEQLEALLRLATLLERWAGRINLTAHRTRDAILRRLVVEAAALLPHLPEIESLVDLGSGAGFPGLPIAVLRPPCRVTLVEARERRHHFQRAALRELELPNARALRGRAEDLEPEPHHAVIAQAVARPARALPWLERWARPGGWLLLPGGERPPDVPASPEIDTVSVVRYRLPQSGPERTLWIGRRR